MRRSLALLLCLLGSLLAAAALAPPAIAALEPGEILDDPALEARARTIGRELRCVVCQNQSIDDSNAELAQDFRRIVRERLMAGDSDDDILRFMVDRYGAFVLLRPPVTAGTVLLWAGPFLVLLLGGGMAFWTLRRRRAEAAAPAALSAEERLELDRLLRDDGQRP